jgi:two-component system, response regulator PdtaR
MFCGVGKGQGLNVLLVEDEPLILMDIEASLHESGYRVTSVTNADAALEILGSQKFDAVLTDIDMPGSMDGLQLAVFVRERWPPIEIIVMSGKNIPMLIDYRRVPNSLPNPSTCRTSLVP